MLFSILASSALGATLTVTGSCGGAVTLDGAGFTPGGSVAILSAADTGNTVLGGGPCAGTQLGLDGDWQLRKVVRADAAGEVALSPTLPAPLTCGLALQLVDAATCAVSEVGRIAQMAVGSPAYPDGGVIPDANSCQGVNESPELRWADVPAGTQSLAVFFRDDTTGFNHSAIWGIDPSLGGLPAAVDRSAFPADVPGAIQPRSYAGWYGYAGPCPGSTHTYSHTLYALDVAELTEIDSNSTLFAVRNALEAHAVATAALTGSFTP